MVYEIGRKKYIHEIRVDLNEYMNIDSYCDQLCKRENMYLNTAMLQREQICGLIKRLHAQSFNTNKENITQNKGIQQPKKKQEDDWNFDFDAREEENKKVEVKPQNNAFDDLDNLDFGGEASDSKVSPIQKSDSKKKVEEDDNGLFVDPDDFGDSEEEEPEAKEKKDQDIFNTSNQKEADNGVQPQASGEKLGEGEELDEEQQKKMVEEQFMLIYN